MNLFETVKASVSVPEAARSYGLKRLVANDYRFTISERSKDNIDAIVMVAEKSSVMEYLKNAPEGISSGKQKKHEEEVL